MNRRGFIGLLTVLIVLPLAKIFPKRKAVKRKSIPDNWIGISPETRLTMLKMRWLDGAPLGVGCKCKNKITVERGTYETHIAEKAYVTYCPKHGFDTDCWMCNHVNSHIYFTTELCEREHYSTRIKEALSGNITPADVLASAPKAYGVTSDNFRPQLTSIKDIMKFANE